MKYVALLSGGKDSCYNLLHCARNGHELVAAASLGPENGKEELDSYLYQTVGQDAIELVARALSVPLYRQVITGSAIEQGSEYGGRRAQDAGGVTGDETEDLFTLLSAVKANHPGVQGVSVGAILSNYQRVRVEHVCARLRLTTLAYLWQRDQSELLSEMVHAGMEAVLIKVAGIGLTTKHLGMTLAQMQPTLVKLNDLYGSHICGEGGEYETYTLDCPLFKQRIVLDEVEIVVHSDNDFATVAYLRIKSARLEDKASASNNHNLEVVDDVNVTVPPLLDEDFEAIEETFMTASDSYIICEGRTDGISLANVALHVEEDTMGVTIRSMGQWVAISHIQHGRSRDVNDTSIEDEVRECFEVMKSQLQNYSLSLHHIASMTVLLSDMSLFPRINAIYGTYFGSSPPSRACVAVDLPSNIRVRLECLARYDPEPGDIHPARQALHVQALSYWAPANIGPYSQAILLDERLFISGQIGLVPSDLTLPSPRSLLTEAALCFQHVTRVEAAVRANSGSQWNSHPQLVVYWLRDARHVLMLRNACDMHDAERMAPTLFLVVKSLPRDALIEKQVLLHTRRVLVKDGDEELLWQDKLPLEYSGFFHEGSYKVYWTVSGVQNTYAMCALICVRVDGEPSVLGAVKRTLLGQPALSSVCTHSLAIRLFHKTSISPNNCQLLIDELFDIVHRPAVTAIPCRTIGSRGLEVEWDFVLCIIAT